MKSFIGRSGTPDSGSPPKGPVVEPPRATLLASVRTVGVGAVLGYLAFRIPLVTHVSGWEPYLMLGVLFGGLAGPLIEMVTHGVRGWGRRFILGYMALSVTAAMILPLVVFGGGIIYTVEPLPVASSGLLLALLLSVAAGHFAFVRHRSIHADRTRDETVEGDLALPLRWLWLAGGIATLLLIGWISYQQPENVSLHFLYLAPTSLVAWATGRWGGTAMAIVAMNTHTFTLATRLPEPPMSALWLAVDAYILLAGLCVGANLVGTLRGHLRREAAAARHDALTGLPNRRGFMEFAGMELSRSARFGTPVTLACIDLDDFKTVNDALGHAVGDTLLQSVSQTLRLRTREHDFVARMGGDEFAVLLPSTGPDEAQGVLEKLRSGLTTAMAAEGWPVTFSIGAVAGLPAGSDPNRLMETADALMYRVKQSGKDGVVVEPLLPDEQQMQTSTAPTAPRTPRTPVAPIV